MKLKKKIQILPKGTKYTANISPYSHSIKPWFYSLERTIFACLAFRFFQRAHFHISNYVFFI